MVNEKSNIGYLVVTHSKMTNVKKFLFNNPFVKQFLLLKEWKVDETKQKVKISFHYDNDLQGSMCDRLKMSKYNLMSTQSPKETSLTNLLTCITAWYFMKYTKEERVEFHQNFNDFLAQIVQLKIMKQTELDEMLSKQKTSLRYVRCFLKRNNIVVI